MATQKSSKYPYQWPNGEWHSITWAAERARQMTTAQAQQAKTAPPPVPIPQPAAPAPGPGPAKGGPGPAKGLPMVTGPAKGLPMTPAPGTPAPTSAPAPAAGGSAAIVPDAQYLAEAAQRAFERTTKLNELGEEGRTDRTQAQEAIRRMLEDALQGQQTIREGAGKEGLFYSGQLSKRLGTYEQAVQRARGDVETSLQSREDARSRAIAALQQGAPLEEATALAGAGQRQVIRDTSAADLGALVPNTPAPAATAVPAVKQLVNRTADARSFAKRQRVWVPKRK